MNKILVAGALVSGLIAAPAMAADIARPIVIPKAIVAPGPQGYVGVGGAFISSGGTNGVVAVGGAVNVPWGGLNVEIEGKSALIFASGGGSAIYGNGTVHLFARNPAFALGGFGGYEGWAGCCGNQWYLGAEAQSYMGNMILTGQVAFNQFVGGGPNGWFARGGLGLFLSDNTMVNADLRYTSNFLGSATPATTFGIGAETRFAGSPWSLFGTARFTNVSGGGGGNVTTGLVGIRAHLGNSTLKQEYTTGASFNIVPAS